MKEMTIDIETRSDRDLKKCGVYAYVDSPHFAITLFSVSVDGGAVRLYDLACGDTIPLAILHALTDESVIKRAFNVNFERICLSKYLREYYPKIFRSYSIAEDTVGDYLSPVGWQCTMVHCRYLGLPSTLAQAGKVLRLEEQKMPEGKALIRYFCVPCDTVDGIPVFHSPTDAPEKWEIFKQYNMQDVASEMAIDRKLSGYPVPEYIWEQFYLDQEINDRGIAVDMELVDAALTLDGQAKAKLSAEMCRLTGVENPNSVYQLLDWLEKQGYAPDSLDKQEVRRLLQTAKDPVKSVLEMRLQLSKSSVKKYTAMQQTACSDHRARGMFSFYGASRTGRFCLTGDHEVLTDKGWCRLDEWQGGKIACWTPNGEQISFQKANALSFPYTGEMYEYSDKRISQISTPDHRMYVKPRYDKNWMVDTVENMAKYRPSIPFTGYRQLITGMEHGKLRVLVMVQADGHYTLDGDIRLGFVKQRKVERCKKLLRAVEVPFNYRTYEIGGKTRHQFVITARDVPMWLRIFRNKTFDTWLFDESPDVFFDELVYWDGYQSAKNSIQYTTCNKQNADIIQAFAHMSGRAAQMKVKVRRDEHPNWSDAYYLDIWLTPKNAHEIKVKPTISHYSGMVYCAETKTGFFLVRRNGKVWVTGNSGRNIQLQNLPQNHIIDLTEARETVKYGYYDEVEMLYEDVPDTLSQLIRTAFVPRKGYKFIVADFSAIEARVIAWLAGEDWRLAVFADGGDIYCASASQMFGVPVVKNGVNGHLRQKGKIAELALGYGGSVGALKSMGAIEMGLQEEELQPLVDAWRDANPNITALWWSVDRAVKKAVKEKTTTTTHAINFICKSGMLFIELPSGRRLAYVKPRIGENKFGGESVTYEGNTNKKWERLESYGPKFVENIVQAIARDILCYALQTLSHCFIVAHVHDEIIMEADRRMSVEAVCEQMARVPDWAEGLQLRADGYECEYYKKD